MPDSDGFPDVPALFTANLMLDEPPFIAKIEAGAGAMVSTYTGTSYRDQEWRLVCSAEDGLREWIPWLTERSSVSLSMAME